MTTDERLWTVGEVAKRLGVARSTVSHWCATGVLPAIRRLGAYGQYRIPDKAVRILIGLDPGPMPTLQQFYGSSEKPSSD